jgi:RHS repeat-associated protein
MYLRDKARKGLSSAEVIFTHAANAAGDSDALYSPPRDSQPQPRSSYGLTTLFQGRTWHEELGLYHYRARWYLPEAGVFAERDPEGYRQSPSLYQFLDYSTVNAVDPYGKATVHVWRYRGSRVAWGHASMTLEDGTYISWWPQSDQGRPIKFWTKWVSRDIYEAPAYENRTLEKDQEDESGNPRQPKPPDNEIKLRSLNEPAIKIWWENYKRDPRWRTLDRNCSTTVATALKLGMPEEFKSGPQWWWVSQNLVWTPEDVEALALYIQKKEQEAAERKQAPEGQLEQFLKPLSLGRGEVSRAWGW